MASVVTQAQYHDEAAAYAWVEARLWPNGPECPRCHETKRVGKLAGKSTRPGVYKCYVCRKPFTVKIGTVMEASNVKLHLWLQAFYLLCSSKKGCSSHQLARTLGIQVRSAWFLSHRIREAMRTGSLAPMGGTGGIVEVDETFIGRQKGKPKRRGYAHKMAVLTLVDRDGDARSVHIDDVKTATLIPIVKQNIAREARVATDEAVQYRRLNRFFVQHEALNHLADEWTRGEFHTNTVEGYFSIFKRGMKGIYQHCSEKHLHRYLSEYDFRYNNRIARGVDDQQRTEKALAGVKGKRLKYRDPVSP